MRPKGMSSTFNFFAYMNRFRIESFDDVT